MTTKKHTIHGVRSADLYNILNIRQAAGTGRGYTLWKDKRREDVNRTLLYKWNTDPTTEVLTSVGEWRPFAHLAVRTKHPEVDARRVDLCKVTPLIPIPKHYFDIGEGVLIRPSMIVSISLEEDNTYRLSMADCNSFDINALQYANLISFFNRS